VRRARVAVGRERSVGGLCVAVGRERSVGRVRVAGALVATLVAVAACVGCGGEVELPDLFVVQRTGSGAGADLTLVVNEGGAVHCYASPATDPDSTHPGSTHPTLQLSDPQLVLARGLQEELREPATKHLSLPPRPGSALSYYVRDPEGTVRFSDNSSAQPAVLRHLAYFVLEVAQSVCHLRM
jgi:hypothetical protein